VNTVELRLAAGAKGVVVVERSDGEEKGHTAVPTDDWMQLRQKVMEHYDLSKATRVDCTNIITALTAALEDR